MAWGDDKIEVIWGKLAGDDFSGMRKPTVHTMNDIALCYYKDMQQYALDVETVYDFRSDADKAAYLKSLLDDFTAWMEANGHDTKQIPTLLHVFGYDDGYYDTIPEVYSDFRFRVLGYCQMVKGAKV